jgi:hypothetical protein
LRLDPGAFPASAQELLDVGEGAGVVTAAEGQMTLAGELEKGRFGNFRFSSRSTRALRPYSKITL